MKTMILFILTLFLTSSLFAQGIAFENLTLQEALDKAGTENKLVFVDCYTSWCGPCKLLSGQVFTRREVGDFFNGHFVNLKMNMEQGEGVEVKKKWNVTAYPTMLLLRPDGKIQHKIIGFRQAEELIRSMQEGMNEKTSLSYLQQEYESGNRDKELVLGYVQILLKNNEVEKAFRIAGDFMEGLPVTEKEDPELWPIYSNPKISDWGSPFFDFLLKHKASFVRILGEEEVDRVIYEVTTDVFATLLFKNKGEFTRDYLPQYLKELQRLEFRNKDLVLAEAEFTEALFVQDPQRVEELYTKFGKKFSNKGVVNLYPLILQSKDKIDREKFKASYKLIGLLEAENGPAE